MHWANLFPFFLFALGACSNEPASSEPTRHQANRPRHISTAGPSFDCSSAKSRVETLICNDPKLGEADALMGRLYAEVKVNAFGSGPTNEPAAQREWLKERSQCLGGDKTDALDCLRRSYEQRNEDLAVAAIYSNPGFALTTLRKLNPEAAPLSEAIYLYAGEPVGANWNSPDLAAKRGRLLALLEPDLGRLARESPDSVEILKDAGVLHAEDALKSDEKFAHFVQMDSTPRYMPCAAIVRHPKLLAATESVWGSHRDSFVISADCEDTLPPVPQFTKLVRQIQNAWPDCLGSIKFSYYRDFHGTVNRALLSTEADLEREKANAPMPHRRGLSPALVKAAITDLSAYYQRYGRASSAKAPSLATAMVRNVMSTWETCDDQST